MPTPHEREEALFALALEKPAEKRAAFLDAVCEGDPALRQRLDALLAAHGETNRTLEPANLPVEVRPTIKLQFTASEEDRLTGQTIGRYKLLQQLGEGGCGVVYMAEQQEPVKRRVALKVIKPGMDTRQVLARFEAERQALALMDHPNIAKVFDAGATEAGRPYFVMELVRGIKVTEYCDQNNLSTGQRLELFIQICRAVQHAHQKGVIHRDIKPSNILVTLQEDGTPTPKIIDFGIAKAAAGQTLTDKTIFTAFEQFIGTPAYMSPEQAEMMAVDIDTRSDIYSLGVLLYELLTGQTPFEARRLVAAGLDEIRRIIREEEPPRPSTRLSKLAPEEQSTTAKRRQSEPPRLFHLVRGDLDWIVMKCLEKDRTRRYETANGLASDIQRHLDNEPVVARPPSQVYRFQKMARRNKLAFAACGAVTAALLLGLAGVTWEAIRATRAERVQRSLRTAAETAGRNEAEQRRAAESEARRADEQGQQIRLNLAASDFDKASNLIGEDREADGVAYLCRSLRLNPTNYAAAVKLASLLAYRSWLVPVLRLQQTNLLSAKLSPDGQLIMTESFESCRTVRRWDVKTGKSAGEPFRYGCGANWGQCEFTPDGQLILAVSDDGASLREARTGRPIVLGFATNTSFAKVYGFRSQQSTRSVVTHDGNRIATIERDPASERNVAAAEFRVVRIRDARTGQPLLEPLRHQTQVYDDIQISPDGTRMLTYDQRGANLWDAESGQLIATFRDCRTGPFSKDGTRFAITSTRRPARLCDARSGRVLLELKHDSKDDEAEISPDGARMITISGDRTMRMWDTQSGASLGDAFGSDDYCEWSPDGRRVASFRDPSDERGVRIWDVAAVSTPSAPRYSNDQTFCGFSPDGKVLLTKRDDSAQLWDARTGEAWSAPLRHADGVNSAAFAQDGKHVLTTSSGGTVCLWAVERRSAHRWSPPGEIVEFSSDGTRLVTKSTGTGQIDPSTGLPPSTIRLWDADKWQPLTEPLKYDSAQFSHDGGRFLTSTFEVRPATGLRTNGLARLWNARTGQPLTEVIDKVVSVRFSHSGQRFLVISEEGSVRTWDTQAGQSLTGPLKHPAISWAEYSPDDHKLITAAGACSTNQPIRIWDATLNNFKEVGYSFYSTKQQIRVWDAQTGVPLTPFLEISTGAFVEHAASPDGKRLVTCGYGDPNGPCLALLWDLESGKQLAELDRAASWTRLVFSPDGKRIVGIGDAVAAVWDAQTGRTIAGPFHGLGRAPDVSADAKRLLLTDLALSIRVWDAETGLPLTERFGSAELARPPSFGPDARLVVTMGLGHDRETSSQIDHGGFRIWDAQTGQPLTPWFIEDREAPVLVGFSADGRRIVTKTDGRAFVRPHVWDIAPVRENFPAWMLTLAEALAGVRLSENGLLEETKLDRQAATRELRDELNQRADTDDDWVRWGRWLVADVSARTVSPFSPVTAAEQVERLLSEARLSSVREAETLDCGNGELKSRVAQALESFETAESAAQLANRGKLAEAETLFRRALAPGRQSWNTNNALFEMWMEQLADVLERENRMAEAEQLLNELLSEKAGRDLEAWGFHCGHRGHWKIAAKAFTMAIRDRPNGDTPYHELARLLVQLGDTVGYRTHCERELATFGSTTNRLVARRTAKDCLILPDSGLDFKLAGQLADIAVRDASSGSYSSGGPCFEYLTKALAEYRLQDFEEACKWAEKTRRDTGSRPAYLDAQTYLVLAMSQFRLKHAPEARATLAEGIEVINSQLPRFDSPSVGENSWGDWIITQALLREAKALIEGAPHTAVQTK